MLFVSKSDMHLALNSYHNSIFDKLFQYVTWLGEWPPFFIGPLLLFYRYRAAIIFIGGNVLAFGITQLLKHTFFSNAPRPVAYFQNTNVHLKLVEGVENWLDNSFPSGHTTTAFATFFGLALLSNDKLNKFLFFFVALSVGYSRIYLSQHFFDDIYAGSIVGVLSMSVVYLFMQQRGGPGLDNAIFKRRV